ncbi:hypothetical protein TWF281_008811 [Arthrobotrys megalospora]
MSNSRISGEQLVDVLSTATWVGAASPKYSNLILTRVFEIYAEYARSHRFTITKENLIEDFGTRPSDVEPFMEIFGGEQNFPFYLTYVAGLVPNLPHKGNIPIVVPLFAAFTVMTFLAVGLRMWSRHKVAGGIRSFDWLALAGFGLTIIYGAVAVYHSKINGPHQYYYDRSWDKLTESFKIYLVLTVLYPFIMAIIKISLLLFYYRVATLNYVKWAVYATGSLTIANTVAAIFTHCLQYRPINYWDHLFEHPVKFDTRISLLVFGAVYIATDVAIWIIPMPMVFQLKLYPREKIIAVITFSLGAVACVASGFRLWTIDEFQNYSANASSGLMIDAWTIIELNLTLICASAPAVRALAIHYAPKILSTLPSAFTTGAASSEKSKAGDSEKSVQVSQTPVVPKEVV